MAAYGTDLALLATGSDADGSGTWAEVASPYDQGGAVGQDGENLIQGVDCVSGAGANKSGFYSVTFDAGSDISGSFATGDVVMMWTYFAPGSNLYTYANGGGRIIIASNNASPLQAYSWRVTGRDKTPNPKGGWYNFAVDPTHTPDYTDGTGGNNGAYRWFGWIAGLTLKIAKGAPTAVDAIRYGRGEIYCTGTGCNFTDMAQYNDYNDATNGYNVLGLFEDTLGGTFLWKGLMSVGQSGTSATFSDSNKSITIDDCPRTYPAFNKIEVRNASTSMTWTNISFFSRGTYAPGLFEMVENATVNMTGCNFNNMGTFIFQSNATIVGSNWNGCGQITHGGADFDGCKFQGYEGTAGTAYMTYAVAADPDGELDNGSYTKGTAATHAIEFDATNTPTTITLRGITFSGYNASNGQNDSTLYFPSTSKSYTVNLIGCSGNISYRVGSGGSVTFVVNPVTTLVTIRDNNSPTKAVLAGVAVHITASDGTGPLPFEDSVAIVQSGGTATVTHNAHGLSTGQKVLIEGANETNYNGTHTITKINDDSYSYTVDSGTSSPATGTIIATAVIIDGITDSNGQIQDSRSLTGDQPISGYARSGSGSIPYSDGDIVSSIDSTDGTNIVVLLNRDT